MADTPSTAAKGTGPSAYGGLPRGTVVGFALALGALAVVTVFSVYASGRLGRSHAAVTRTLQILGDTERLLSLMKDAETGQRGYLLVGDPSYLAPYQAARQAAPEAIAHLRGLLVGDAGQLARLGRAERLVNEKLDELEGTVRLAQSGRREEALAVVRTNRGQQLMDALREVLGEVERAESSAFTERTEDALRAGVLLSRVAIGGSGLLFVLTLLAGGIAVRDFRAQGRAAAEHLSTLENLRQTQERFRVLVEGVTDYALFMVDAERRIAAWNPGAERLYGWRSDEIVGRPMSVLYPPGSEAGVAPEEELRLAREKGRFEQEVVRRRRDGTSFFAHVVTTPLVGGGDLQGFAKVTRDVTERRRYEQRLEALHAIDRGLLQAQSVDEMARTALESLQGHLGCDRAALVLCEEEEQRGRVLLRVAGASEIEDVVVPVEATRPFRGVPLQGERLANAGTVPEALRPLWPAGLAHAFRVPLRVAERDFGALCIAASTPERCGEPDRGLCLDVATQLSIGLEQARLRRALRRHADELQEEVRRRTAELVHTNAELEAFSYSVSHDLRAPLRAIEGFAQAVEDDRDSVLTERSQRFFGRIRANATRMASLIDDLLRLSRVTRTELVTERVDLSALASQVLEEFAEVRSGRVQTRVAPGLVADGDRQLLRIALENLLGNAVKFSGKVDAPRVELFAQETGHGRAFVVRDNGAGFDMQYAGRLFTAFQRLHDASEFAGTGIGLALVARIVARHGGRIWADSRPGEGASFFFTLGETNGTTQHHPPRGGQPG